MTETTKRIIIAAVAAVVLIAGSVTAIALVDDSDDDRERPLVALAEQLDEEFEAGEILEQLLERFLEEEDARGLPDRLFDLFDALGDDLLPPRGDESRDREEPPAPVPDDRGQDEAPPPVDRPRDDRERPGRHRPFSDEGRPFDGFGFRFGPGEGFEFFGPFFEGFPLEEFLADGRISPAEAEELQRWFREHFGGGSFGFGYEVPPEGFAFPPEGFVFPNVPQFGIPFGDLPLEEFLEDGHISPDEARELERLFQESVPGGMFRFEFVPPETDRARPLLPEAFLEGLGGLPWREFLADDELTPEERELLREALNEWLTRLFERFDQRTS